MRKVFISLIIGWLVSVTMSLVWNQLDEKQKNRQLALQTGRAFFRQIVHTRSWNARHGGVYVPVTESIKPNPYLKVPNRDLITSDGRQLTMVNPAFMTRLIGEIADREDGVTYHITSLKPIRPANAPDKWEKEPLEKFESGLEEFSEFIDEGDSVSFRYMAPLYVEQSCLACHGHQGYQVNDVRGGISINIPFIPMKLNIPLIFSHIAVALVGVIGILFFGRQINRGHEELMKQSRTDSLTGLANRREMYDKMEYEYTRLQRSQAPFSLLMGDLDFFKSVNDTYGHNAGDLTLKIVAEVIRSSTRLQDVVGRWGGEEFMVLLPGTDLKGARKVAEKILIKIRESKISYSGQTFSITMTIGVVEVNPGSGLEQSLKKADDALYEGKREGRNRFVDLS